MTQVVLIRPGTTDYDDQHRIQGTLDVAMNARGAEEVARTAEQLRDRGIVVIYHGCGDSACRTAAAIGNVLGARPRQLEKLKNLNHGLWQGLPAEDVQRKHPRVYRQWRESPLTVCPPGGEMINEAYERVRRVLRPVLKRHRDEVIGIVVPEPLASIVYCYLSQRDLKQVWDMQDNHERWQMVQVVPEAKTPSR